MLEITFQQKYRVQITDLGLKRKLSTCGELFDFTIVDFLPGNKNPDSPKLR